MRVRDILDAAAERRAAEVPESKQDTKQQTKDAKELARA
jgi:hypothetical protein